jgi:hypothetical protein
MVDGVFVDLVEKLCAYYEKRVPGDRTLELWRKRVFKIPDEATGWIERRIQDDCDMFPRNLPTVLWAFYYQWQDAHPEKQALTENFDCPECDYGLIIARRYNSEGGLSYSYVFRCGRCDQKARPYPNMPKMRKSELLADGYKPLEHTWTPKGTQRQSVREMVSSIGNDLPDDRTIAYREAKREELKQQADGLL